jgi:glycosyltransferase involved in cell wall biosynthesis
MMDSKSATIAPVIVSVVIPAYNEEANIEKTIASLLDQTMPREQYEIVVVDNNSSDGTWEIINRLPVKAIQQPVQGAGPARQKGMEAASGIYILNADADVFYPREWIFKMSYPLIHYNHISCVYSTHRFFPEPGYGPLKLYLLRKMRSVLVVLKSINRPWLNCYGMSMGYRREQALKIGFDPRNYRGEDGRLAYDLQRFGKIHKVDAPVYTHVRTLKKDGRMLYVVAKRLRRELPNLLDNLRRRKDHDTRTSTNVASSAKNKAEK